MLHSVRPPALNSFRVGFAKPYTLLYKNGIFRFEFPKRHLNALWRAIARFVMGMRVLAVGRAVERAYWEKAVGAGLERGR